MLAGRCVNGMHEVEYTWADADGDGQKDCDPDHPESIVRDLPNKKQMPCHQCTKGMSRDEHGNCTHCTLGKFQPDDLDDKPEEVLC